MKFTHKMTTVIMLYTWALPCIDDDGEKGDKVVCKPFWLNLFIATQLKKSLTRKGFLVRICLDNRGLEMLATLDSL